MEKSLVRASAAVERQQIWSRALFLLLRPPQDPGARVSPRGPRSCSVHPFRAQGQGCPMSWPRPPEPADLHGATHALRWTARSEPSFHVPAPGWSGAAGAYSSDVRRGRPPPSKARELKTNATLPPLETLPGHVPSLPQAVPGLGALRPLNRHSRSELGGASGPSRHRDEETGARTWPARATQLGGARKAAVATPSPLFLLSADQKASGPPPAPASLSVAPSLGLTPLPRPSPLAL